MEEMTPKLQLCACSFQDSLRQKNWALEQIRKFPDTIGYGNDSNTLRVDVKIFVSAKKYLRKKNFWICVDIGGGGGGSLQGRKKKQNEHPCLFKYSYSIAGKCATS